MYLKLAYGATSIRVSLYLRHSVYYSIDDQQIVMLMMLAHLLYLLYQSYYLVKVVTNGLKCEAWLSRPNLELIGTVISDD